MTQAQNAKPRPVSVRQAVNQRQVQDAIWRRDRIRQILGLLTDDVINELARRGELLADTDGFPTGGGGGHSSEVSRPTEIAVLGHYRQTGAEQRDVVHRPADPVGEAIRELFASLGEAHGVLEGVASRRDLVLRSAESAAPAGSRGGYCDGCERWVPNSSTDCLRKGFCDACRKAFDRDEQAPGGASPQPDRELWALRRRAAKAADRVPTRPGRSST